MKPSLRMDQLQKTKWKIQNFWNTSNTRNYLEKDRIIPNYEKLFKRIRTIKHTQIKKELERDSSSKQKTIPMLFHLQSYVQKEINKLFKSRYLEKHKT